MARLGDGGRGVEIEEEVVEAEIASVLRHQTSALEGKGRGCDGEFGDPVEEGAGVVEVESDEQERVEQEAGFLGSAVDTVLRSGIGSTRGFQRSRARRIWV